MPTVLLFIIFEQTVPNYLFIKVFQNKVDRFVFLSTLQIEQQNKTQLICDTAGTGREKINTKALTEYIYKLLTINKRFGLSARSTLFTLGDLSQLQAEAKASLGRRLYVCGINGIFDRNSLTCNFKFHLQEFLK